jgi:hypothetical protein
MRVPALSLCLASLLLTLCPTTHAVSSLGRTSAVLTTAGDECLWPRGGKRCCGTLRTPGAKSGWRTDETDHCFPANAGDHYVCCVDIQSVGNAQNTADPSVARYNPLEGPITRNSDASSYSWCVCSVSICRDQLNGTVAWVGKPGAT